MKKIISKQRRDRKQNIKQWVVGIVLIGVMLFSVIAGGFVGRGGDSSKKVKYNGFEFIKQGEFWTTEINEISFIFNYNPKQIEEIGEPLNGITNYRGKPLYIFSGNNVVEAKIYQNLFSNGLIQRMQKGCPEDEVCEEDIPIKTCEDNFIIMREKENLNIYQQENCVFIEGKKEDFMKLSDEFLFKILSIR